MSASSAPDPAADRAAEYAVGDIVRCRAQFACTEHSCPDGIHDHPATYPEVVPSGKTLQLWDGDFIGIVREVRDDGLFVEELPRILGKIGDGQHLSVTHSTLVEWDRVTDRVRGIRNV